MNISHRGHRFVSGYDFHGLRPRLDKAGERKGKSETTELITGLFRTCIGGELSPPSHGLTSQLLCPPRLSLSMSMFPATS